MSHQDVEPRWLSPDELIDAWESAWTGRDSGAFVEICTHNVTYEDPLLAEPLKGPAAIGSHAERLWAAFPDARLEKLGTRLAGGLFVSAPSKLLATNHGPLENLPTTGRALVLPMIFYCQLERGRLLRVRAFFDLYDAGTQLGVMPNRGSVSEKALLLLRGFGLRAGR